MEFMLATEGCFLQSEAFHFGASQVPELIVSVQEAFTSSL